MSDRAKAPSPTGSNGVAPSAMQDGEAPGSNGAVPFRSYSLIATIGVVPLVLMVLALLVFQFRNEHRALLEELRRLSLTIYEHGARHARERGIILADTKFEFGRRPDGTIVLGDEVLTPDSSRFWPVDGYEPGRGQPSFDKQFVRDWAAGSGWDKSPPAPPVPDDVVEGTRARYQEAYERITGEPFSAWLERSGG